MTERRTADTAAGGLAALAFVGGLVQIVYLPFWFGPLSLIAALTATVMSDKYRRLNAVVTGVVAIGFLIGASVAVWYTRSLY
ncbi:MAG: hypothetical protein WCH31_07385 [Actinomycetes bacterium]